jgi:hypothetical protein
LRETFQHSRTTHGWVPGNAKFSALLSFIADFGLTIWAFFNTGMKREQQPTGSSPKLRKKLRKNAITLL